MRQSKRVELSTALCTIRNDILKKWQESLTTIPRLNSKKGSRTKELLFEEMEVFLDSFLKRIESKDRRKSEESLRRMANLFFQVGIPHSILTHAQIRLKRILMRRVIELFKDRRKDIAAMCDLLESEVDQNRIFLSDEFEGLALRSLEASERNYRDLIEEMEDLVFRVNLEGKVMFANSASLTLLGAPVERILGRRIDDIIYTPDRVPLRKAMNEVIRRRRSTETLCRVYVTPDKPIILNFRIYPVTGDGGEVHQLKGIARDVTQTKNLELELRKKIDEIKVQWEVGKAVSATMNVDLILAHALEALFRVFNYPICTIFLHDERKKSLYAKAHKGYPAKDARRRMIKMGEGITGRAAAERKILLVPDLSKYPASSQAHDGAKSKIVIPLVSGNRLIGVLDVESPAIDAFDKEDIIRLSLFCSQVASAINNAQLFEELSRTNEELNEKNLLLDFKAMELETSQRILEGMSEKLGSESIIKSISIPLKGLISFTSLSLFLIGSRKNLLIVNRVGRSYTHGTDAIVDEIVGEFKKTKIMAKEMLERPLEEHVYGKAMIGKSQKRLKATCCLPLVGENGVFGALHISDSGRDSFNQEEKRFLRNVTSHISLGLSRLFSIQEYHTRMEEISRMKMDFSSVISHELRTPMTSLKNSIDILLSGKAGELDTRQNHFLKLAKKDITRLIDMINDVLELSRLESGPSVINKKSLEVRVSFEGALSKISELAKERDIVVMKKISRSLPKLYADPEKLQQILVHLLSNAIKFSERGGKIQISARLAPQLSERLPVNRKLPPGWSASSVYHNGNGSRANNPFPGSEFPFVEISVRDWGAGIARERLDMIFEKFTQEDSSITRAVSGVGLGLSITRHLTVAHNGILWAESKIGDGSVFRCLLPAHEDESIAVQDESGSFEKGVS